MTFSRHATAKMVTKDEAHKNWLHFCREISLSSYYRDQWSARKFNKAAI